MNAVTEGKGIPPKYAYFVGLAEPGGDVAREKARLVHPRCHEKNEYLPGPHTSFLPAGVCVLEIV